MTKPRLIFNIAGLVLLIAFFYLCFRASNFYECMETLHEMQNALDRANTEIAVKELALKQYQTIEDWTEVLRIKPDDHKALNERGLAYAEKGDYDKAIEDLSVALKIKPDDIVTLAFRGFAYDKKSNYDKAIEDYTTAIKIEPDNDFILYRRGCTYYDKGNYDKAINDLEAALKIDPNNTKAKQLLEKIRQTKAEAKK